MEEIGRRLQAARLAKGVSLQQVEDETRIRKKYIEALEAGRTTDIPGEVYLKGFLRSYANFLQMDGEALVEEYKRLQTPVSLPAPAAATPQSATPVARESAPLAAPAPEPRRAEPTAFDPSVGRTAGRIATGTRVRSDSKPPYHLRRLVVALAVMVPLAGVAWWFVTLERPAPVEPPPVVKQEDPAPPAKENPSHQPAPEPPKPTVTLTGPTGEAVAIAVTAPTVKVTIDGFRESDPWMRAWGDGKQVFDGFPQKKPLTFEGKEVVLRMGHMNGIDLLINGVKLAEPLQKGPYTITIKGQ